MPASGNNQTDLRERAVRMVADRNEPAAVARVAEELDLDPQMLHAWLRDEEKQAARPPELTREERERFEEFRREVFTCRRC